MNKKGAEKIISVYWFAILLIVAGGIVYMVSIFYGKPYDVREIEVGLLTDKAADCVSYAGYLNEEVLTQEFREDLIGNCGINFETENIYDWGEEGQYFLQIEFYDFNSLEAEPLFSASAGNQNLKSFCEIEGKNLPVCLERELYTLDQEGKLYTVKITSIIRKTEKNV